MFPAFRFGCLLCRSTGQRRSWLLESQPGRQIRQIRRGYHDETLVLETEYDTDEGVVSVIDCMPPRSKEADLVRIVVGRRGQVSMRMRLVLRPDYGSIVPWVRRTKNGICALAGPDTLTLQSDVDLRNKDLKTDAEFKISAGQRLHFVLTWLPSHDADGVTGDAELLLAQTEQWWQEWANRCTYRGPYRASVVRSLVTLKALTYAPTGGIVAAPTTSLPEHLGGLRNWDYRYCWVRDATFTLYALLLAGYTAEACAWRDWLLRAVAGKPSQMNIMYGLAGERRLPEIELGWLPGYEGSAPVRIGNAACEQFQLDVYGELMDAMHLMRRGRLPPDENAWRVEQALLDHLESVWSEPDNGIWEMRGPKRHFTHSKVMAWVAIDRMVKAVENFGLDGPVERWRAVRATIHDEVCRYGFDREHNTFVQYYGGTELDASLLMISLVGFLPAGDSRIKGTVEAIERDLTADGFVLRYRTKPKVDGLPPGEAAFLPCSFWLADNLALLGRREDVRLLFERLIGLQNDVGLMAEEYDPARKRHLGNFPQAFSHVALINTASNLSQPQGPAKDRQQS
jgi:GH15 family glucan-1,4-alpha-glucosidase